MVGRGTGNFLTYTHDFGGVDGDFTMTAQMKLFDLDGSAGTFMIKYVDVHLHSLAQRDFAVGSERPAPL